MLACTSAEARYLEKIGVPQERLRILGAGVDTLAYRQTTPGHWKARLNIGQEEFSALFMSTSLSTGKGADQVAQASLALPEVHFIFAGGSNAEWQDLAARVRPGANCHYVGFVDGTEKHQLFKAADLFVMPSVNDAFGIVYLEAMAAGKPVITANIDSMREVAGDAGLSVAHGDAEALVRAIRRFQQDQGLYRRCQEAAIRRAESCSWENLSARLENIYLELLEKRGLKRAYVAEKHV
ncbi:MAG: glycosyltransferase [Chloroflexi bacterium]|nr:glycosyltransferase [Chloroflexota bacterium]